MPNTIGLIPILGVPGAVRREGAAMTRKLSHAFRVAKPGSWPSNPRPSENVTMVLDGAQDRTQAFESRWKAPNSAARKSRPGVSSALSARLAAPTPGRWIARRYGGGHARPAAATTSSCLTGNHIYQLNHLLIKKFMCLFWFLTRCLSYWLFIFIIPCYTFSKFKWFLI